MQPEQQQRIMGYFIEEAKDHLNTIEQGLLHLQSTIEDSEMVNEVFRAAHSVKGGAAMLGINSIQKVSHRLEDCFKLLKECPIKVDQKLESLFLRVFDALQELLEQLQGPFGLTEDLANSIMAGVEPVFEELNKHLAALVTQAGGVISSEEMPALAASVAAQSAAPSTPEVNVVLVRFQNDVPNRLREMLQLFKQTETVQSRQQLQEICDSLKQLGEQFESSNWCQLLEIAGQAIACPDNAYRVLAPIIIREIKQAQELVLASRISEILINEKLQELLPVTLPLSASPESQYEELDFLASITESNDAGAEELTAAFDPFGLELTQEDALVSESVSDESLVDWLSDSSEQSADGLGLDLDNGSEAGALGFEDFFESQTESLAGLDEAGSLQSAEQPGPEVGMAELNSLADLFEGEVLDLGVTWQKEEVVSEPLNDSADLFEDVETADDFSDLLFDHEVTPAPPGKSDADDLASLFGNDDLLSDDLLEVQNSIGVASSSEMAGTDSADLVEELFAAEVETFDLPDAAESTTDWDGQEFSAIAENFSETSKDESSGDLEPLGPLFTELGDDEALTGVEAAEDSENLDLFGSSLDELTSSSDDLFGEESNLFGEENQLEDVGSTAGSEESRDVDASSEAWGDLWSDEDIATTADDSQSSSADSFLEQDNSLAADVWAELESADAIDSELDLGLDEESTTSKQTAEDALEAISLFGEEEEAETAPEILFEGEADLGDLFGLDDSSTENVSNSLGLEELVDDASDSDWSNLSEMAATDNEWELFGSTDAATAELGLSEEMPSLEDADVDLFELTDSEAIEQNAEEDFLFAEIPDVEAGPEATQGAIADPWAELSAAQDNLVAFSGQEVEPDAGAGLFETLEDPFATAEASVTEDSTIEDSTADEVLLGLDFSDTDEEATEPLELFAEEDSNFALDQSFTEASLGDELAAELSDLSALTDEGSLELGLDADVSADLWSDTALGASELEAPTTEALQFTDANLLSSMDELAADAELSEEDAFALDLNAEEPSALDFDSDLLSFDDASLEDLSTSEETIAADPLSEDLLSFDDDNLLGDLSTEEAIAADPLSDDLLSFDDGDLLGDLSTSESEEAIAADPLSNDLLAFDDDNLLGDLSTSEEASAEDLLSEDLLSFDDGDLLGDLSASESEEAIAEDAFGLDALELSDSGVDVEAAFSEAFESEFADLGDWDDASADIGLDLDQPLVVEDTASRDAEDFLGGLDELSSLDQTDAAESDDLMESFNLAEEDDLLGIGALGAESDEDASDSFSTVEASAEDLLESFSFDQPEPELTSSAETEDFDFLAGLDSEPETPETNALEAGEVSDEALENFFDTGMEVQGADELLGSDQVDSESFDGLFETEASFEENAFEVEALETDDELDLLDLGVQPELEAAASEPSEGALDDLFEDQSLSFDDGLMEFDALTSDSSDGDEASAALEGLDSDVLDLGGFDLSDSATAESAISSLEQEEADDLSFLAELSEETAETDNALDLGLDFETEPTSSDDLDSSNDWLSLEVPAATSAELMDAAALGGSVESADAFDFDSLMSDTTDAVGDLNDDLGLDQLSDNAASAAVDTDLDDLLSQVPAEEDMTATSELDFAVDETESSFDDLEALLNDDSVPDVSLGGSGAAEDDFADLEALLGDDSLASRRSDGIGNAASAGSAKMAKDTGLDSEFDDLEKLLEDADKTLGGPPTIKTNRGPAAPQSSRRAPRRGGSGFGEQTMRVPVKHLDNLSNLVGELVVNRNSLEQDQERLRQFLDNLLYQVQQLSDVGQRMRDLYERSLLESSLLSSRQSHHSSHSDNGGAHSSHSTGASFDALEMDRFTGFHTLSQEMIELIVRVRESASDIEFIVDETDQVTRMFRQVTTQLQEGLTRSRMVPFAQTADRLPRAVRDIALKCGKQAELYVEGRETLIDKMILEQLYDPMTHLVNNAIAHGIESPDIRQAAGKPPVGRITIRAFHQGNQTVISVSDDGAGIDPDRVKSKAIEKRLITPEEARNMSRLDVYDLLFHPGFTTKDQVTDYAGRGVGMDVVRTSLSEIRGVINTDSAIGKGTTFTIRLPLTLSISKALCCISNRARIAFPMDGVEDMLDVPKERIQTNAEGEACILWRDLLLPFRPLDELLKYNRYLGRGSVYGGNQEDDIVSIVVLRSAGNFIALQVDQVLGEQEIVIKQLEGPVPKPIGVAGATVLGDGRIMPIADVLELIDLSMGRLRREASPTLWDMSSTPTPVEAATAKTDPTVLIVDDSITVRELLSMTFNKVGYRVEQARDGQEAWEKLRSGLPCDMVFCDIEMPRMDGLELLSRIQKDPSLNHLPIAMLTSRGADRHRQMAVQLGAKGYFTKPYLEEALLDAAQRMLKGEVLITSSSPAS